VVKRKRRQTSLFKAATVLSNVTKKTKGRAARKSKDFYRLHRWPFKPSLEPRGGLKKKRGGSIVEHLNGDIDRFETLSDKVLKGLEFKVLGEFDGPERRFNTQDCRR